MYQRFNNSFSDRNSDWHVCDIVICTFQSHDAESSQID